MQSGSEVGAGTARFLAQQKTTGTAGGGYSVWCDEWHIGILMQDGSYFRFLPRYASRTESLRSSSSPVPDSVIMPVSST